MRRELLPIGTVVLLEEMEKAMMICGFCPTGEVNPGYVYDYSGFPYPEGYAEVDKIYQFDHDRIKSVLAIGYQDAETLVFMNELNNRIDIIKETYSKNFYGKNSAE